MQKKIAQSRSLRVMDANFNRAKEGLRVCEDVYRFVLDNRSGARRYKRIRHGLTAVLAAVGLKEMVLSRDIARDVGRATVPTEASRSTVEDIYYANAQRVKESLRVLEEFAKLERPAVAEKIKLLRYDFYDVEKNFFGKGKALPHS